MVLWDSTTPRYVQNSDVYVEEIAVRLVLVK